MAMTGTSSGAALKSPADDDLGVRVGVEDLIDQPPNLQGL
jgi:hypothetical protein